MYITIKNYGNAPCKYLETQLAFAEGAITLAPYLYQMRFLSFLLSFCLLISDSTAQLPDSCKLRFGTNISGLADWGTELPFVDMMHHCRTWYTKDVGNPNGSPWDTQTADSLSYRPDGYPTAMPQMVAGHSFPQKVATVWAITDGWTPGKYVVLFEGTGKLSFWGGMSNVQRTHPNRYTFQFAQPVGSILEMAIDSSLATDPVRNIRVVLAQHEFTHHAEPFNPVWLDKLLAFGSVRFMDWGHTNSFNQTEPWDWDYPTLEPWTNRASMDHYTWANSRGIPYEMMIRLMNDYDLDGWVCVPHRADSVYVRRMAELFRYGLEPERHLTVEYSNETWNWIFGQAQWCNKYGLLWHGGTWPECTVPFVQRCMDIWTEAFAGQMDRITRVVGVQAAWQDVSNRIVFNMRPGSFDAFSPACYFGINEAADAELDALGSAATVADIARWVRTARETGEKVWLRQQKAEIGDVLDIPMIFYEGGQHITPQPFGEEPTYAQALLDIQRDTSLYNLYVEWFDFLRTLQEGPDPLTVMHFSFVSQRSARYGSWGVLETMTQDTSLIPAPKYRAVLEQLHPSCWQVSAVPGTALVALSVYPNPSCQWLQIDAPLTIQSITVLEMHGTVLKTLQPHTQSAQVDVSGLPDGALLLQVQLVDGQQGVYRVVKY